MANKFMSPTMEDLCAAIQKQQEVLEAQQEQLASLRAEVAQHRLETGRDAQRREHPAPAAVPDVIEHTRIRQHRIPRVGLLKAAVAGAAGLAGASFLSPGGALAETESKPEIATNLKANGYTGDTTIKTEVGVDASLIPYRDAVFSVGVWGAGSTVGVKGSGTGSGTGVYGEGSVTYPFGPGGPGVHGVAYYGVPGVLGEARMLGGIAGPGVQGVGAIGVTGLYTDGATTATISGQSAGVYGSGAIGQNSVPGVKGYSDSQQGVWGISISSQGVRGESTDASGVFGLSKTGLGAQFQGGRAAIRLNPTSSTGHPSSGYHQRGELVVDSHGALWYCTADGFPGNWKQIA